MKFVSQYKKLTYWIKPSYHSTDSMGNRSFVQGVFVQFNDGFADVYDPELIKAMIESPDCGRDFAPVRFDENTIPVPEATQEQPQNYAWAKEEANIEEPVVKAKEPEISSGDFVCPKCGKICKSKIGLLSHVRNHK